ncbi:MAG: SBBP repeat-containing protein [Candidatus Hermodarchaeota archaeon]
MSHKKICFVGFIVILYLSFMVQGTNIIIKTQDGKANKNVVASLVAGNPVAYEWNRTWGREESDAGTGIVLDSAGNIYIVGYTELFDPIGDPPYTEDIVLVKYDRNGEQQWVRIWGGEGKSDYGTGVAADSSDNIYLSGYTESFGAGRQDMVLVKYNGSGSLLWNHTWGGHNNDYGYGVVVDSQDNIYLAGGTSSFGKPGLNMVLVKYNGSGSQLWNCTWGGNINDISYEVTVDSSGNVYLVGRSNSFGGVDYDIVLVKYNGNGIQQWNRTWGGSDYENCLGVEVDSSGNIYLAGFTENIAEGDVDMVLVKCNSTGIQQWNCTWDRRDYDLGYGIVVDSSENIYLTGFSEGSGYSEMVLVKYDGKGELQWNQTWGVGNGGHSYGLAFDSLGNIYLVGDIANFVTMSRDMILVKFDNSAPYIKINSPNQNEAFGSAAPNFNLSIEEPNLDMIWYTLDEGTTNFTINNFTGTINQTEWDKIREGPVSIRFYTNDTVGYIGFDEVIVIKCILDYFLYVDVISQSFSINEFNITFSIHDKHYQGIDYAIVQMWWNGVNVSDSVKNLRNGLYYVSLEAITVPPGENPILLKMKISAEGFEDKFVEMYLAVDPDTLDKDNGSFTEGSLLNIIIIAITSVSGGLGFVGVLLILMRRRKIAN